MTSPFYNLTGPFNCCINGYEMAQNILAAPAWMQAIIRFKPDLVIEIGTGTGGFAALLRETIETYGGEFVTMENNFGLIKYPHPTCLHWDCFEYLEEIEYWFKKHKQCFILCDGGNKIKEFNTFSKMLKVGDVIAAHDYCDHDVNKLYWDWAEIKHEDIEAACFENKLIGWEGIAFQNTGWITAIKAK